MNLGTWRAVAVDSVNEAVLRSVLADEGVAWERASHVAATTSLARALRSSGAHARQIASLVDLFVMPGLPGDMRHGLEGLPRAPENPSDAEAMNAYENDMQQWQTGASGRRLRIGIEFDQVMRQTAREFGSKAPAARALIHGRRQFARTVHSLVMAGFRPGDFDAKDDLSSLAVRTWSTAEDVIPALSSPREDLWTSEDELGAAETQRAQDLDRRLKGALDAGLGRVPGRRLIVHHGFYFFTPPQWALFRLIRTLPHVDQLFVIHDDGANPAFETWRRFFDPAWEMPVPELRKKGVPTSTYGTAFQSAITGERVDASGLEGLKVLECRSPAELVRAWAMEGEYAASRGAPGMRRFAADAETVERYAARLGRGSDAAANLAQLPIGAFLFGMHDCIAAEPGERPRVILSSAAIIDILGSGFLELPEDLEERMGPRELVGAFSRAQEFFAGCEEGLDWVARAEQLRDIISGIVSPYGVSAVDEDDMARANVAANNPLRVVPWADLRPDLAGAIHEAIKSIVGFAQSLVEKEEVLLGDHLTYIRKTLRHGLSGMPPALRSELAAKIAGFSVGLRTPLDVEGLVDIVSMLLGRSAVFDSLGEMAPSAGTVAELRALDALGFRRLETPAHVANLSDAVFPAGRNVNLWPFRLEDHCVDEASPVAVGVDLMELRSETSGLSDMYLLWLALDGADVTQGLTLSWISKVDGEHRNLSPLAAVLLLPDGPGAAIRNAVGGLEPERVDARGGFAALGKIPDAAPASVGESSRFAEGQFDRRVVASAEACTRRFAIQWLTGPSPSYGPPFLQEAAYGNVQNALVRLGMQNVFGAASVANAVWRHLTAGQRASSINRAVVSHGRRSADPAWIYTLKGTKGGTDPLSRAYQVASGKRDAGTVDTGDSVTDVLPPGVDDPEVCKFCPVQARCLAWSAART